MIERTLIVLLLVLLAGCRSDGDPKADPPEKKPKRSAPKGETKKPAKSARVKKPTPQPGSGEAFTAEQRANMEAAWKAFVDDSPNWPLYRDDWVSMGPMAVNTLVENLYRAMILAQQRSFPEGYDRARKELILLGPAAVPTLVGILQKGVYHDSEKGEDRPLPSGLVTDITNVLVAIGGPSVVPMTKLLESDSASVRRASADGLGRIRDPRGFAPLVKMLRGSDDWTDRMIAAQAVSLFETPEAEKELIRALDDRDESVVTESARALARRKAEGAVPALERRIAKARKTGDFRVEHALNAAVKTIRGAK